jgi:prepilin-type N-terminal cleavage/methylation domain-containing protein
MKNSKGFTMIEFLVIVFIIGLLAAIAMSNFILFSQKQRVEKVLGKNKADHYREWRDKQKEIKGDPTMAYIAFVQGGGHLEGEQEPPAINTEIKEGAKRLIVYRNLDGSLVYIEEPSPPTKEGF